MENFMPQPEAHMKTDWLDDAIRHLESLCQEAAEFADEGDIMPTRKSFMAASQILKTFCKATPPKIGLTGNGELTLVWENTGDVFRAYAKPDGSTQFFQNKQAVDMQSFSAVARLPA